MLMAEAIISVVPAAPPLLASAIPYLLMNPRKFMNAAILALLRPEWGSAIAAPRQSRQASLT
jgi:hypothetical protein